MDEVDFRDGGRELQMRKRRTHSAREASPETI
jgi:hypothetical protein